MTRPFGPSSFGLRLLLVAMLCLLIQPGTARRLLEAQATPTLPERRAEMQHHFLEITRIHDAVIRGDLPATRRPAEELSGIELPAGLPPSSQPFLFPLRVAGKRALQATTVPQAARAAATMLAECGECHRSIGVRPDVVLKRGPDIGGLIGHMLEHQVAIQQLEAGLFVPSGTDWQLGAERLQRAPLAAADLPPDKALTKEIRGAEKRVHELAAKAAVATETPVRVSIYADVLGTCAECHQLHRTSWGPTTTR